MTEDTNLLQLQIKNKLLKSTPSSFYLLVSCIVTTMDFDSDRLYFSHQQLQQTLPDVLGNDEDVNDAALRAAVNGTASDEDTAVDLSAVRRHFREFLRNHQVGARFLYREKLLRMHRRLGNNSNNNSKGAVNNNAKLPIDLAHLEEYDAALLGFLMNQPALMLPPMEQAASDALQSLLYDMNKASDGSNTNTNTNNNNGDDDDDENMGTQATDNANGNGNDNPPDVAPEVNFRIQILLQGKLKLTPLRHIRSEHMHRLIKCPGIVISTSPVQSRAVQLAVRCATCGHERVMSAVNEGPWASITMPVQCPNKAIGNANPNEGPGGNAPQCGAFPYTVVPDASQFVDQQTLKLQEEPERVPTGEMPRSVLLAVDRALVDTAPPGTRVSVICIPTLLSMASDGGRNAEAPKQVYLRVVGLAKDDSAHGNGRNGVTVTPAEEEAFVTLARNPQVFDILTRSMAPSLMGAYTVDIKKALTCQLFSGSRKRLPDGVQLRGDINVLLLGDPSTAKSQFLKFVSQVAPIGIYTSGKGSSAAGLTASVVKNAKGEFYLEGGAMVLADGGVVCIDEFDKMVRPVG
jgi:DNA replication licensing factor MCM5